jgi:hypothetical protein
MEFFTPKQDNASGSTTSVSVKKQDIVGDLVAFTMESYEAALETEFGHTTAAFGSLTVIDGDLKGTVVPSYAAFGLLGKQLSDVAVGQTALGRVSTGTSNSGRSWYGFDFSSTPADQAAAVAVVESASSVEAPF